MKCVLAPGGNWLKEVRICSVQPPNKCDDIPGKYKDRARFTNSTTLQIEDIRPDESGIYKCRTVYEQSKLLISGIIIVGRLYFVICLFSRSLDIFLINMPLRKSAINIIKSRELA